MTTRALVLLALAALLAAPAALADGGPMYSIQGGQGIAAPNGAFHYVAVPTSAGDTTLLSVGKDGSVVGWAQLAGSYGIPMVTFGGPGGLSRDGRTLFLQSTTYGGPSNTSFVVVDTRSLDVKDSFFLKGTYAFDALSPDGKRLYLTQHEDASNASRYVVRAYDLARERLLPGRIADRTQRSWIMQGDAVTRTVSPDGRWVYTLYMNPGGYPFIHALDTVRGVAHCVGLPWRSLANQSGLGNVVLALHGSRLAVHWRSGRPWLNVDTRTWRVTPAARGGFPWRWLTPLALVLVLVPMELLRRRRRSTAVSVQGGSDESPARLRARVPLPARMGARGPGRLSRPRRDAGRPGRALARRHAALSARGRGSCSSAPATSRRVTRSRSEAGSRTTRSRRTARASTGPRRTSVQDGWSVSRAASANGRWVYTLYASPGGQPFVHALDTVAGVAHCAGLPRPQTDGNQQELFSFALALESSRLVVRKPDGAAYRVIDATSWRVSKPTAR